MTVETFESQTDWIKTITHSITNFQEYPKRHLSLEEQEFGLWLQEFKIYTYYKLITADELVQKVMEIWDWLLEKYDFQTVKKHLVQTNPRKENKSFFNREYTLPNGQKYGLWLFSKGLIQGFHLPVKRAKYVVGYGYPVTKHRLDRSNFIQKFPPHDYFASMCFSELSKNLGSNIIKKVDRKKYSVPHSDGSGNYVADNVYWLNGEKELYLWQEVHTGSESADLLLKRLLSMEQFLKKRNGYYVIFVPFVRDVEPIMKSIKKYNESGTNQRIELTKSYIVPYTHIEGFKEKMGIYNHQKR